MCWFGHSVPGAGEQPGQCGCHFAHPELRSAGVIVSKYDDGGHPAEFYGGSHHTWNIHCLGHLGWFRSPSHTPERLGSFLHQFPIPGHCRHDEPYLVRQRHLLRIRRRPAQLHSLLRQPPVHVLRRWGDHGECAACCDGGDAGCLGGSGHLESGERHAGGRLHDVH